MAPVEKVKPLAKNADTENYKKQQFYVKRTILADLLAIKADGKDGDLSDILNAAAAEYIARKKLVSDPL